jgi:capsular polysaccharide export protein
MKTILAVGYYDDFARFFLAIKKEFKKKDAEIRFTYFSIYLSGYLYFILKFNKVSFFSFRVWLQALKKNREYTKFLLSKSISYKGINLNKIISYHLLLEPKSEIKLKKQAMSYIDIVEKCFSENKPDLIILSGDSRMCIEIFDLLARRAKIKTFYFEQGPFGTTILDENGVNANASIRIKSRSGKSINTNLLKQKVESFLARNKNQKYIRNPLYRVSDFIFQTIFYRFKIVPPDIYISSKKNVKTFSNSALATTWEKNKNIFLLILQVPYDANMVIHSPHYKNHFSIVKDVYESLPHNSQLIVREHPLFRGKYERDLYLFMKEKNISIDVRELYQSINNCDVSIVNNSTVGIEAISKLKTLVVLGNAYYDNHGVSLKLNNKSNLKQVLFDALGFRLDHKSVYAFLDLLFREFLIEGHFRDKYLIAPRNIVNKIYSDGK